MKFYTRFDGQRFCMPDGKILTFVGGMYETAEQEEIKELSVLVKRGQLSLNQLPLVRGSGKLLREIGGGTAGKKGAGAVSGTGMANSASIAELTAALSNSPSSKDSK